MSLLQELGYVTYGVRDLDRATEFFRNVIQLEVTHRSDDAVFLSGDTRHHWVRLEQCAEPGLLRLAYRAVDAAAITEIARQLDRWEIDCEWVDDVADTKVTGALRFTAPDGIAYEVYDQMLTMPASFAPSRGITCLLHAVLFVADTAKAVQFYTDALGFLVSDRIENVITFLRCGNGYHHALAVAGGPAGTLDHIAILVDDLEDVLRFRAHGLVKGALSGDIVKHVASNSVSVYLHHADDGIGVEFCNGHNQIADETYRGRLIKAGPITVNAWSAGFPDRPPIDPLPMLAAARAGVAK